MKPARRLGLPLIASVLAHAYAAWHLYAARQDTPSKADRDRFEVRMFTLPPPAVVPEPPPPAPPPPEVPAPRKPPPAPEPRVRPQAPEPPPDLPPAVETPPSAVAPPVEAPVTAPPALLAEGVSTSGGGVVQRPGNAFGSFASGVEPPSPGPARVSAPSPNGRPPTVTPLRDLSRKPRPPSLDAALRRNYPADHRRRGVEGQAEVRVLITAAGRVGQTHVVSESAAGFGRACQDTLLGTRWSEPVSQDGKPVNTRLTYRCRFEVGD